MAIQISPADDRDIEDLARLHGEVQRLHARLYPELFCDEVKLTQLEEFWTLKLQDASSFVGVARQDELATGFVYYQFQRSEPTIMRHARRRVYVHQIVVANKARRSGVGAALMRFVETEARNLSAATVGLDSWVANSDAQAFFKALGYSSQNVTMAKSIRPE